jgi:uncharacterized protein (TIGR03083 family)
VERDQILAATAEERRRIADLIDDSDDVQLATPSLCAGWDVKTVAAHLLSFLADGTVKMTLWECGVVVRIAPSTSWPAARHSCQPLRSPPAYET